MIFKQITASFGFHFCIFSKIMNNLNLFIQRFAANDCGLIADCHCKAIAVNTFKLTVSRGITKVIRCTGKIFHPYHALTIIIYLPEVAAMATADQCAVFRFLISLSSAITGWSEAQSRRQR